jgi:AbrB family looped-hinge helix DNA binding protein
MPEIHVPKLTRKGQVTIPKWLRDSLGLKRGSKVTFEVDSDGRVVLKTSGNERPPSGQS